MEFFWVKMKGASGDGHRNDVINTGGESSDFAPTGSSRLFHRRLAAVKFEVEVKRHMN